MSMINGICVGCNEKLFFDSSVAWSASERPRNCMGLMSASWVPREPGSI